MTEEGAAVWWGRKRTCKPVSDPSGEAQKPGKR